mgnify:CR=1
LTHSQDGDMVFDGYSNSMNSGSPGEGQEQLRPRFHSQHTDELNSRSCSSQGRPDQQHGSGSVHRDGADAQLHEDFRMD